MDTPRNEAQAPDLAAQIRQVIADTTIPEVHFNGFINAIGQGDILIVLQRHGRAVLKLSASYTVAKTLAQKLGETIADLEKETGHVIMTTEDIQRGLHDTGERE